MPLVGRFTDVLLKDGTSVMSCAGDRPWRQVGTLAKYLQQNMAHVKDCGLEWFEQQVWVIGEVLRTHFGEEGWYCGITLCIRDKAITREDPPTLDIKTVSSRVYYFPVGTDGEVPEGSKEYKSDCEFLCLFEPTRHVQVSFAFYKWAVKEKFAPVQGVPTPVEEAVEESVEPIVEESLPLVEPIEEVTEAIELPEPVEGVSTPDMAVFVIPTKEVKPKSRSRRKRGGKS